MKDSTSSQRRAILSLAGYTLFTVSELITASVTAATIDLDPIDQPSAVSDQIFIDRAFEMRRQAIENLQIFCTLQIVFVNTNLMFTFRQ